MLPSSQRDNVRSNEPCACEKDIPDGCLHPSWDVFFCKHTANAATTRNKRSGSESVGMAESKFPQVYLQGSFFFCNHAATTATEMKRKRRSGIEVWRCEANRSTYQ